MQQSGSGQYFMGSVTRMDSVTHKYRFTFTRRLVCQSATALNVLIVLKATREASFRTTERIEMTSPCVRNAPFVEVLLWCKTVK